MADFIRLPNGSLILTRDTPPEQSKWQKIKGAMSRLASLALPRRPEPAPYWIPQQVVPMPEPVAPSSEPASAPSLPAYNSNPWSEIEDKAKDRERIVKELGDFPKRMMESPLVEGRLF